MYFTYTRAINVSIVTKEKNETMNTKTLVITIFICLTQLTNAQETIKTLGVDVAANRNSGSIYYKDVNQYFNKFLGEWLYDDGTTYFKVTFIKKEHVSGVPNHFRDELACEYLLKINGITIYNTYGANSNLEDSMANQIVGSVVHYFSPRKIDLSYSEPPLNGSCERYASGKLLLEYTVPSLNNPELIWTRTNNLLYGDTTQCADGTQMDTSEFLIPANMTLIKQ